MGSASSTLWLVALVLVPAFAIGLITILATQIRKYICFRHELEFKREMVERGLSIDEIERVVAAKSAHDIQ